MDYRTSIVSLTVYHFPFLSEDADSTLRIQSCLYFIDTFDPFDKAMPPKRPNKRRSEDDAGSLRLPKKGGKNKKEVTYDTYDEALDGESFA